MAQKRDNKPRRVIIKQPDTKIRVEDGYIEAHSFYGDFVVGLHGVDEVYIHKDAALEIASMYVLAKYVKVYLIDARGNILGKFKRYGYE